MTALSGLVSILSLQGEQATSTFEDEVASRHVEKSKIPATDAELGIYDPLLGPNNPRFYYSSTNISPDVGRIRFQVVIASIGAPDVSTGRVPMKFRVTMYWNLKGKKNVGESKSPPEGRVLDADELKAIAIPAVAILNADSYEVIGAPECVRLREATELMRWTCMYSSTLMQEEVDVKNFPHDHHVIRLMVGLKDQHREEGAVWDRRKWKLALATEEDTLDNSLSPKGFLVNLLRVPGFVYNRGLEVGMIQANEGAASEIFVVAKLTIARESGFYDTNIVPLLCMLTVAAVCTLSLGPKFFPARGIMLLSIAFLQIGLRMTMEPRLPDVGYEINIQQVMREFLMTILIMVIESGLVFYLSNGGLSFISEINQDKVLLYGRIIDLVTAIFVILRIVLLAGFYYIGLNKKNKSIV